MTNLLLNILCGVLLILLLLQGSLYLSGPGSLTSTVDQADAIVLLSGSYRERAPAAALLFRERYAGRIILTNDGVFSSWSQRYGRNLYQVEWAEEQLVSCGVGRDRIVKLPGRVNSTMSEALLVSRYARLHGLKKIILVTSDYHAVRALWSFRLAFPWGASDLMAFGVPSPAGGERMRFREWAKLLYYQARYGLPALAQRAIRGRNLP